MGDPIKSYVSRYVIPFYFDNSSNDYSRIQNSLFDKSYLSKLKEDKVNIALPSDGEWIKAGFWENYRYKDSNKTEEKDKNLKKQPEMDLYSYLPRVFQESDEENANNEAKLGASYTFSTNGLIFKLDYLHGMERIPVFCNDLGIVIYKNGLGFIWYEIGTKNSIDVTTYIDLQHDIKELARPNNTKFVKKYYDEQDKKAVSIPFCMGVWISRVFNTQDLGISFLAERKIEDGEKSVCVPDKALLFQYLFLEKTCADDRKDILFHVSNGFNASYNTPESIELNTYKPFANSEFYISNAGMCCLVTNEDSNENFFTHQFKDRYVRDYFFIYILLLYQSYSCVHFSRLLTELPADEKTFRRDLQYVDKLDVLSNRVNLFLVKSVFDSVSNMHHQNGVYRYGKDALSIEADIRSLTVGLDALRAVEFERKNQEEQLVQKEKEKQEAEDKEKREQKIDRALTLFGLLVVISALLDGLNLVDWMIKNDFQFNPGHIVISAVIVLVTVYLLVVLFKTKLPNKKNSKKEAP